MIHSRLRRSFRLAVDLLSLNFAGSSSNPHSAHLSSRGNRADPSPVLPRSAFPALRHSLQQRPEIPHAKSSGRDSNIGPRRHLASYGLLLAISLEVGGCDPQPLASGALNSAFQNLHEPARSDLALSFYDPSESVGGLASAPAPMGSPFGNAKSVPAEARPLPWDIPESVYFVYKGHHLDGLHSRQPPVATAFVLSVPNSGPDSGPDHGPDPRPTSNHGRSVRFLVTARHVVDPQWAHCSEQNPASIDLRLNRRSGGVGYETIPLLSGAARRFYTPLDTTADIAVIPLDHNLISAIDDYKLIDVPFHLLLTDSEIPLVRADQQVMTARPSGELTNYPVFDGGVLSKMSAETVGVRCGILQNEQSQTRMLHVWFINAGVPQGVSGAPVYTSIARGPGTSETRVLLGIQSVAWPDKGIAGITPSPVLGDLIRSAIREDKHNLDFNRGPNR